HADGARSRRRHDRFSVQMTDIRCQMSDVRDQNHTLTSDIRHLTSEIATLWLLSTRGRVAIRAAVDPLSLEVATGDHNEKGAGRAGRHAGGGERICLRRNRQRQGQGSASDRHEGLSGILLERGAGLGPVLTSFLAFVSGGNIRARTLRAGINSSATTPALHFPEMSPGAATRRACIAGTTNLRLRSN